MKSKENKITSTVVVRKKNGKKGQSFTTIPVAVRKIMQLENGDKLSYNSLTSDSVVIKKEEKD